MSSPFAITHVTVITGDSAGTVHDDWTVVVDSQGRIEYAGPARDATVPTNYRDIDGRQRYLTPGIINAHAHLFSDGKPLSKIYLNPSTKKIVTKVLRSSLGQVMMRRRSRTNARTQLYSGVTTVRTVGDVAYEVIATRESIAAGKVVGPRILPSGPLMAITGGHGSPQISHVADVPEQARSGTKANLDEGATAIKVSATGGVTDAKGIGHAGTPEMTVESMTAVCEQAHEAGVPVAAHAQSTEGVLRALQAGVDTIEHGSSLDDQTIALFKDNPRSLRGWSALIPTLQACLPLVKLDRSITGIDDVVHANAELVLEQMVSGIRSAIDNDIQLGMGTDSGVTYVTHANAWREIDFLIRFGGLTAAQALHAATQSNARILGLDNELGSIEQGKSADLVLLDKNPLESARALSTPHTVIARGRIIENPSIPRIQAIDDQLDRI